MRPPYIRYNHDRSKYGNRKIAADGEVFDSQLEHQRWISLRFMERAGQITDLKRQVKFTLIPAQKDDHGKVIERKCEYIADFVYRDAEGRTVVEDAKGFRTPEYVIKRKLMLYLCGIRVKEIRKA